MLEFASVVAQRSTLQLNSLNKKTLKLLDVDTYLV